MPLKTDSGNPADWLLFAREDLAAVSSLAELEISYHVCQSKLAEALEKILKAELISRGWFLEKIHDLAKLIDKLSERHSEIVDMAQPLAESLAEAYFSDRYPGFDLDEPNWDSLRQTLGKISSLLDIVQKRVDGCSKD